MNIKSTSNDCVLCFDTDESFVEVVENYIGKAIHALRVAGGLTQQGLSTSVGDIGVKLQQSRISRAERGSVTLESTELLAICRVLSVSPDQVFELAKNIKLNERLCERNPFAASSLLRGISSESDEDMQCRAVNGESASDPAVQAANMVRIAILEGKIGPGTMCNVEEFARQYGTTAGTILRAFRILVADCAVIRLSKSVVMVPAFAPRHILAVLQRRLTLETAGAFNLSQADQESAQSLRAIHEQMVNAWEKANDPDVDNSSEFKLVFTELDLEFHQRMLRIAGHEQYCEELRSLTMHLIVGTNSVGVEERPEQILAEHHRVIEAIGNRDRSEIVSAIANHMIGSFDRWFETLVEHTEGKGLGQFNEVTKNEFMNELTDARELCVSTKKNLTTLASEVAG